MTVQTRPGPGRSDRDKLEKLQEQLRAIRARRAELSQEKAELLTRTAALEQEMRGLRRALGWTQGGLERSAPSLPDHLLPPFEASPALRTGYGRLRRVLKLLPSSMVLGAHLVFALLIHPPLFLVGLGAMVVALLLLLLAFPVPEDADAFTHWSFDDEGFFRTEAGPAKGKVLYREIQEVRSVQGWLQRLSDLGSVHVTWVPGASSPLEPSVDRPHRSVRLELIENPERLAAWLLARVQGPSKPDAGETRVD